MSREQCLFSDSPLAENLPLPPGKMLDANHAIQPVARHATED